jgi:hypothetical protein
MKDQKPHLILVEGQTDKDFFLQWITLELNYKGNQAIEIKPVDNIAITQHKGVTNVENQLKTLLSAPPSGVTSLLVIVDADDDYGARWKPFKAVFEQAGFTGMMPNRVATKKGLSVGAFIVGEKTETPRFRDLDTLLFHIRTHQEEQYQRPLNEFNTFVKNNPLNHPNKSKLSLHMAHLPVFCVHHFGEALKNNYFKRDAPELAFLEELINCVKPKPPTETPQPA